MTRNYALSAAEAEQVTKPLQKAPTLADIERELAKIDKTRRQDSRAYWRDEKMQRRELQLIEAREKLKAGQASAMPAGADLESIAAGLDPALVAEWGKAGGVAYHLEIAQKAAQAVFAGLDAAEQEQLTRSFDSLPAPIQLAAYRFIAINSGGQSRSASEEALRAFEDSDLGKNLVGEWGDRAPQKLGAAQAMLRMMLDSMPEADRRQAEQWLDDLPPRQASSIMRALAG